MKQHRESRLIIIDSSSQVLLFHFTLETPGHPQRELAEVTGFPKTVGDEVARREVVFDRVRTPNFTSHRRLLFSQFSAQLSQYEPMKC